MSNLDRNILYFVSRIKRRMNIESLIKFILLFVSGACAAGVLLSLISLITPIYGVHTKAAVLIVLSILLGIALAVIRRPKLPYAAMRADSLGLHERTITALELTGDESAMSLLQKEDTLEYLERLEYKKKIPILPNKRYFAVCLILIAALISTGFIQSPMEERAVKLHELKELKRNQLKDIDKMIEKVDKDSKLTKEQKKELDIKLAQIKKDIKAAGDRNELKKSIERNYKKMELLSDKHKESKKDFDRVVETLLKNDATRNIGELMKKNDPVPVKNAIKNLADKLNNMSGEEKYELSQSLSKLSEELKSNQDLKDALKKAGNKLKEGENISQEDLESLSDALSELMKNDNIRKTLEEISKELNNMSSNKEKANGQKDGEQKSGELAGGDQKSGDQPGGQGTQGGIGQKGEKNQKGQGGQENEGEGQGTGSGAGNGTDPGSEEQTPSSSEVTGLSNKDSSEKKLGEYEKIFTSKTLGGTGTKTMLSGQKNKEGNSEITSGESSQTNKGNTVPYNQVFGQYRDEAFESMNSSNIPEGMKEIVKDYFSSLEE